MNQMSMKLPAKFDRNPPHTFDKMMEKHITTKKRSQSLTLSPNDKVIAEMKRQEPGAQKTCHPKKI